MPEGDTIFRTARTLRAALVGGQVEAVQTRVPALAAVHPQRLVGQHVSAVESRGKHLLCWFSPGGLALHTHMRMSGSWHLYRPGQRWRKPAYLARVRLDVDGWVAVCFLAPVCELLSRAQVDRHPALASLGPDALDPDVDLTEARRRLDRDPDRSIAEALLDQRVLAGLGNVYKCEVLFIHGVDPWARVADVDGGLRERLLATGVDLLRANVAPDRAGRSTTGDPRRRLHVYGRARRPCPRCATPIRLERHAAGSRLTYWCPRCQGPGPIS